MARLLTIEEASKILNVPKASLRSAAEEHGFIVRMGRAIRIDREQLSDLVEKCKAPPRQPLGHKKLPQTVESSPNESAEVRCKKTAERLIRAGKS